MMDASRSVNRTSRSSSLLSQGSSSETSNMQRFLRRQQSGGSSKWSTTLQAATAAMLTGRGSEVAPGTSTTVKEEQASIAAGTDDANRVTRPRRETLYFGKGISTSMWWRFRRAGSELNGLETRGPSSYPQSKTDDGSSGPKLENTYRLEPNLGRRFRPERVEVIMNEVLEREFGGKEYAPDNGPEVVKRLSAEIKDKVKLLCFERYRLVVMIQVGQIEGLDMMVVSRCAWNSDTDCYATVTFQNGWVYAIATTYGIYLD